MLDKVYVVFREFDDHLAERPGEYLTDWMAVCSYPVKENAEQHAELANGFVQTYYGANNGPNDAGIWEVPDNPYDPDMISDNSEPFYNLLEEVGPAFRYFVWEIPFVRHVDEFLENQP